MKIDRRWLYVGAGIALYALAGFLLAPWLVKRTLISTLDERAHVNAQLDGLSINPFTLTLTADGLAVTERDGRPLVAFERLFVNFELISLFRWAVCFDELHLIRPDVHLEQLTETDTNLSQLARTWEATAPAEETPAPAPEPEPQSEGQLFPLVVADLRIVEGRVSVTDRSRAEPFSTDFAPISLAVKDLSTLPDDRGTQEVTIRTESGAEIAWTGTLGVNPLSVTGTVTIDGAHTPLIFRYFRDDVGLPIGLEGGDVDARLDYRLALGEAGELSVEVDGLEGTLSNLTVSQPDHPALLSVGTLGLSGGRFHWPEQIVHLDAVVLDQVRIDAYRRADGAYLPLPPAAEPAAPAGPPAAAETATAEAEAPTAPWDLTVDSVRLTGWALRHTDTTLTDGTLGIADLNLTLSGLSNAPGKAIDVALDVTPEAGGTITLNGQLTVLPDITLNAELAMDAVPLAIGQPYLNTLANVGIAGGSLGLEGSVSSTPEEPILYEGDLRITGLELTDRVQNERLLAWQRLGIDRLKATTSELTLSSLTIDAPFARVEVEQGGTTNLDQLAVAGEAAPEAPAEGSSPADDSPPPTGPAEPFVLTIGETRIDDGSARFEDRNLPLPFVADITHLNGSFSTLASNSNAPSRVDLEGQVNEYGSLKITGSLQPFSPTQGTDVDVAFRNVDLPRMSPYTIKFAGRRIADGRTDLTLSYQMNDRQLQGDNRLVIRDLRLGEKVPAPDAMNLPLDMAVALLKDPSGVVDFNFPVRGSLDDPQFSYSGAIMKAFSNVILGLATAPFKLLGALVGVAPSEFEHIAFEAGQADLSPPQREVLAKLADALAQRPQLTLSLTPVADPAADRRALQEAQVDSTLEALLAADSDSKTMLSERRLKHLEALYDESGLTPPRQEVRAQASPPDENGKPMLDALDYAERLRGALIDAAEVADTELTALADARVDTVRQSLTGAIELGSDRLATLPAEDARADEEGQIRMPLEVSAGSARGEESARGERKAGSESDSRPEPEED